MRQCVRSEDTACDLLGLRIRLFWILSDSEQRERRTEYEIFDASCPASLAVLRKPDKLSGPASSFPAALALCFSSRYAPANAIAQLESRPVDRGDFCGEYLLFGVCNRLYRSTHFINCSNRLQVSTNCTKCFREVCKAFMRRFDPGPRLQTFLH
jgi:hypothetical protein